MASEVRAISDLVGKATTFIAEFGDRRVKGSAELKTFIGKVRILEAKQSHWTRELKRFRMMEDESLKRLMEEADKILDQEVKNLSEVQGSIFLRFKKKAFLGELTTIFDEILKKVDAGPQVLACTVENHELLKREIAQIPSRLPFDHDPKYVRLPELTKEVQMALEHEGGPRVVTVHAGPGMGKSSLVKYLALCYQEERKEKEHMTFPDGVYYLLCGKGADFKVKRLQSELLEILGFGDGSALESNAGSTSAEEQRGEYVHLPSLKRKLGFALARQKLLIILDDVWEAGVLKELIVPGQGLKYLISTQNRAVRPAAKRIELKLPTMDEARKILANYTRGLPTKGEFPKNVQRATDAIILKLGRHPLSLTTIGVSVNEKRATDPKAWNAIEKRLLIYNYLEDDLHSSPFVYGTKYPQTVAPSMMIMVDSLPPEVRRMLFLVALLDGQELPEVLVKNFLKIIQSTELPYERYNACMDYLEERSIVEFRPHGNNYVLSVHGLRTHFIRKNNTADIRSIASQILGCHGSNNRDVKLIQSGDFEEGIVTVLGAMYYSHPFRDVVTAKFEEQVVIFNANFIPRNIGSGVDALDLMERARKDRIKYQMKDLVCLLNPDGKGGWKQLAEGYAKKIIIRFICQGELDDDSIARLLQLPETTTLASGLFYGSLPFNDYNRPFSSTYSETMKALLVLLHDDNAVRSRRAAAICGLGRVLNWESEDDILSVGRKWTTLLGNDSCPPLHIAIAKALCDLSWRARLVLGELNPGVLEGLLTLLVKGNIKTSDRGELARAISKYSQVATAAVRIASFPGALETLFHIFLQSGRGSGGAGAALVSLSSVPENKTQFREVEDGLKGLVELLLASNSSKEDCERAATILGNLALEKEFRETIVGFSSTLAERLRILRMTEVGISYAVSDSLSWAASRALTILCPLQPMALVFSVVPPSSWVCYKVYMGRAEAHREMGLYVEALLDVDQAHPHLLQTPQATWEQDDLRALKLFLKAMVGDYADTTTEATSIIDTLAHRGVLQRLSGNLAEALADFDEALEPIRSLVERGDRYFAREYFFLLKNRGFVRHRMGDEAGARADAESAQELKLRGLVWERSEDAQGPRSLEDLPVSYLGYTF